MNSKKRVVIDTDFGTDVDDALALCLAICMQNVEIVAVTTVGRQSLIRAQLVRKYLQLANLEHIPVYAGCDSPLNSSRFNWKGHEGKCFDENNELNAVDALVNMYKHPTDVQLIAVGMLTNIASAIQKEPSIAQNIPKLTVMGGHFDRVVYQGVVLPEGIDYNLCSDPLAACAVLNNRDIKDLVMVPANVTLNTFLTKSHLERLRKIKHPFMETLVKEIELWTPKQRELLQRCGVSNPNEDNVSFLHDPLTVYCACDGDLCSVQKGTCVVVSMDIPTRVVTTRISEQVSSTICGVCQAVKSGQFADFFCDVAFSKFGCGVLPHVTVWPH